MIPTVRKTWAPRGCTPRVHHWARHDRISAISALSVSPRRKRVGLYYWLRNRNLTALDVSQFLRALLRHLPGPVIVLWDKGNIHRGPHIRALCARHPRLHLEAFPAYAPELNPDEGVWKHSKAALANGRPSDLWELELALHACLRDLSLSLPNLRGCIRQTGLPLV